MKPFDESGSVLVDFKELKMDNNDQIDLLQICVSINNHLSSLDTRFRSVKTTLDPIDASFRTIETGLHSLDGRLRSLNTTAGSIDNHLDSLDTSFRSLSTTLHSLDARVQSLTFVLESVLAQMERLNVKVGRLTAPRSFVERTGSSRFFGGSRPRFYEDRREDGSIFPSFSG